MTESVFFQDMAVVMAIAGLAAALFSRLGWPKVFGYILVGIVMNGHTWGGSFLTDVASISTLGQLGVVFLMLTMGLEFSTSDMKKIRNVVLPTALIDTIVMVWVGYTVGTKALGWQPLPALFLGAALCDSATTLLSKMIGDLGWARRPFVKYVLGTSVCEDFVCVGLLALVTGVANGRGMSLGTVGMSIGGLFLFFLGTLVFGLVVVPWLLRSVGRREDDEALLMTLLGICFFVSWAAYRQEYSLAIGAFLVGILGASSEVKHRLLRLVAPLRSMFAAMFFVSIGLLVDPRALTGNLGTILVLTLTVIVGKSFNCLLGGLLTGQPLKQAVQTALSLAQIGEFAFLVALIYVNQTGDLSSSLFQVAVGVSLLTTVLNPLLIRLSDPLGTWAERRCPRRLERGLRTYRAFLDRYRMISEADGARRRVRTAVVELLTVALLELAVAMTFLVLAKADWSRFSETFERYDQYLFLLLANMVFVAMFVLPLKIVGGLADALNEVLVGEGNARWQPPVRTIVRFFVFTVVLGSFAIEALMLNSVLAPHEAWIEIVLLLSVVVIGLVGWKFFRRAGLRASMLFDEALKVDQRLADLGAMLTIQVPENAFTRMTIGADSPAVGETVVSLDIRAKTGASVVSVTRDGQETRNVGPEWEFRPGDTLVAIGGGPQIAALKDLLGITSQLTEGSSF